jgi:hypothetical protein
VTGRSAALAASFEDAITGVAALVEGCSDAEWQQVCTGEQWSVAVTAHHIAASTSPLMDFIGLVADGQPLPPITLDMIHDGNANHAQAFAQCTREETLVLLRDDGARVADRVRALSDEQLDRTAAVPLFGGAETSAQALIETLLIGHPKDHGGSIKAALSK